MSAKIVSLDDYRKVWSPADCLCTSCSHKWRGVVHNKRKTGLECPKCKEMKGATLRARRAAGLQAAIDYANTLNWADED